MEKKEKFTFRQALINVIIAISIVIGLSLSKGFEYYNKIENVIVILVVIVISTVALISKWRKENRQDRRKEGSGKSYRSNQ